MNIDDTQGPGNGPGNRKMGQPKYPEKMANYSPSMSYNYGHQSSGGYGPMQQNPRRRTDRFKRESLNLNDKVVKQNDIIIRLLKEIRDRLPPPPTTQSETAVPDASVEADAAAPIQEEEQ